MDEAMVKHLEVCQSSLVLPRRIVQTRLFVDDQGKPAESCDCN